MNTYAAPLLAGLASLVLATALTRSTSTIVIPPTTVRVSVNSDGEEANFTSFGPGISGDGRVVAFTSDATNLVDGVTWHQLYVHSLKTGETVVASISTSGQQGLMSSTRPSLSYDGRFVAFESMAPNLVPDDSNLDNDVFVRDLTLGLTFRVSLPDQGLQAHGDSAFPSISADGRYVAFASGASDIVVGCNGGVFVRDRVAARTYCASVDSSGNPSNGSAGEVSISSDGRFVAFVSDATNLVPGDTNGMYDIFVHDMEGGATTRVSVRSDGVQGTGGNCGVPSISGDGRRVAFVSDMADLVSGDTNNRRDVFVHDLDTGETTRVSVSSTGEQADNRSDDSRMSADGRYVSFPSDASNLVPDAGGGNVYVHDLQTGETSVASLAWDGYWGNVGAGGPAPLSENGRYVAFASDSTNLVPGDYNGYQDTFVRDRGAILTLLFLPLTLR